MTDELVEALQGIKDLLGPNGEYAVCRGDGKPMFLGDDLIVGGAFEKADKALEAAINARKENMSRKDRLRVLMFSLMYPEPAQEWDELKAQVKLLAEVTDSMEDYEEWLEQPLPF